MKRLTQKLYAGIAASILTAGTAHAGGGSDGILGVTETLNTQLDALPQLFTSAAYIMGIGFVIAGLFKLKEYVDDPSQGNMKDALIRLAVGALLVLLPFAIDASADTIGADNTNVTTAGRDALDF